jgi:hypothetical protein
LSSRSRSRPPLTTVLRIRVFASDMRPLRAEIDALNPATSAESIAELEAKLVALSEALTGSEATWAARLDEAWGTRLVRMLEDRAHSYLGTDTSGRFDEPAPSVARERGDALTDLVRCAERTAARALAGPA